MPAKLIFNESKFKEMYKNGVSKKEIMTFFDMSDTTYNRTAIRLGLREKDLKHQKTRESYPNTFIDKNELYNLYITQNLKISQISTMTLISHNLIQKFLKKYNIKKSLELRIINRKNTINRLKETNKSYDEQIIEKRKNTCLKKYGVNNPAKVQEIKEKIKNTVIHKYGTKTASENKDVSKKIKETWKNKTREELEEIKNKTIKTCELKYGVEYPLKNNNVLNKVRETNQQRYGVNSTLKVKKFREKAKLTSIKKYGTIHPSQAEITKNKVKQTKLKKYGDSSYHNIEKTRKTCIERYGGTSPASSQDIRDKMFKTAKANNSIGHSKEELKILSLLCEKYEKVEYQYKSQNYPFACDFYIPKLNLYMEYQGFWTHGNEPFINSINQKAILNLWKEKAKTSKHFSGAIKVWTEKDPLKRKIAKENNLNWLEFFTMKEFLKWYDKNEQ